MVLHSPNAGPVGGPDIRETSLEFWALSVAALSRME